MRKFLGIPIARKPLTDAEIVERARKDNRTWERYGKWVIALYVAVFAGWIGSLVLFVVLLNRFGQLFGGQWANFALDGFILGIVMGISLGAGVDSAVRHLGEALQRLKGNHPSALLVKYHDTLARLAELERQSETPPASESGAGEGRAGEDFLMGFDEQNR
jgi:hypothetical protein